MIMWFAFVPSFLTILVGSFYVAYQIMSFRSSHLFLNEKKQFITQLFDFIFGFFKNNPTITLILLIVAGIVILFYMLLPTMLEGGLIQMIARKYNKQQPRIIDGIGYGFASFLPLLEYHAISKSFSVFTVITTGALFLRNTEIETFQLLSIPMVFIGLVGLIMTILFTYTDFFIVIDKEDIFKSISKSCSLVLTNWHHTFLIMILMIIISIRILINILLVLIIPAIIMISGAIIAAFTMAKIGIIVGVIIGIVALVIASYFTAIIHVFADAVWTFTFLELTKEEQLNAREKQSAQ